MDAFQKRKILFFASVAFCVALCLAPLATTEATTVRTLPAESSGTSDLITSNPGTFTGPVVNTIVGANRFYTNGITGQGAIVANVEAGLIWNGHETLTHVTNFQYDASAYGTTTNDLYDRHATWVGMIIGGRNTAINPNNVQTGIAPGADLRSGAIASNWSSSAYSTNFNITVNSFVQPYNTYFGAADVINSSWGFTDASGTNAFTIAMDGFAFANPKTTFVVSAGNSGSSSNTVGAPGSGYNAITVGSAGNANTYNTISGFSSRGPQTWGDAYGDTTVAGARAPVDIVAPGETLTSAYYGGQTGGNNPSLSGSPNGGAGGSTFYSGGIAGTSFAAPIVAGAATLLDSTSYNTPSLASNADSRDSRVIKAVLLNSATKLPGWNNGQIAHPNGNGGVLTTQSLDYAQGAGKLDLDQSYDQYLSGTTDVAGTASGNVGLIDSIGWDYGHILTSTPNDYYFNTPLAGGSQLTVTLDWFRDRFFDPNTASYSDNSQMNLDLTIFDATGGTFNSIISESMSLYNVVEHLSFTLPDTGMYGIRVSSLGTLFDELGGTNSAFYGLAWSGTEGQLASNPTGAIPEPSTGLSMLSLLIALTVTRSRTNRKAQSRV